MKCHGNAASWLLLLGVIIAIILLGFAGVKVYNRCSKKTRKRMKALAKIIFV